MRSALPAQGQTPAGPVARITGLMTGFSIEATRPSAADIATLGVLRRGTRVYLSAVPNRPADESLAAAVQIRAAGLEPVPHVAVRNFDSAEALDAFLARLNAEAGVETLLVIAGDRTECGPFRRALDVIDNGMLRRRGIRSIGIAGYPQGHPRIGPDELNRALADKIAAAEATGLGVEIVTQFCFDAGAILDFVKRVRGFGFEHRVRVGLAGPTSLTALMRYASRCGVRASAQGLARRSGLVRQMFALTTPDDLIRALADAGLTDIVPHFFSFGGIPATARWASAVADGSVTLDTVGGFRVEAPKAKAAP
jgi:methylenetetrahydrofolate reductase (NADPH)